MNNKSSCFYCKKRIKYVDWKDVENLKKFLSPYAMIEGRNKTKLCAKHQRQTSRAIKRARIMALLPFVSRE
jgi:small subunit ribosomal protein S18